MQVVLEDELVRSFLEDTKLPRGEATVTALLHWIGNAHQEDVTLTMVKQAVRMLQDLDLFHSGLRYNSLEAVEAALSGTLTDVAFARGHTSYSKLGV